MNTAEENLKLKVENERLKEELAALKSGVNEVFNTAKQEYPNIEADSYFDKIRLLGIIFKSIESRKFVLNEQIDALDSVNDGIAIFSYTGHLVYHNISFLKLFHIERPQSNQPHWRDLFSKTYHREIANDLLKEVNSQFAVHQEVNFMLDDKLVFFKTSIYPLKNKTFLINIKDVTAEKQKLYKIQEQASLLKSSSELMAVCDVNFDFTFLNDSGRHMLGVGGNWKLANFATFISDKNFFKQTITQQLASETSWIGELLIKTEKRNFPARCEIIPFSSSATSLGGYYVVLQDITERKQAIRKLIDAKNEAEKNMQIKQDFLANMSHEIRTPMNAIIGLSNLMMDTKLNSDQFEFATSIKLSADNLLVIINDVLDLSKIEGGHLRIEKVDFDLTVLIKGLSSIFKRKIESSGVKFTIEVSEEIPRNIIGDPTRLNQILMNLLSNAEKFTTEGHIRLSAYCESKSDEKAVLIFKVEDTGIGIAKENLDKIFEAFTQESNATARMYGGTGLGLTIVNQLVNLQNGKIWVESRIKKGSTFFVQLAYNISKELPIQKEKQTNDKFNKLLTKAKIVMAEDYPMNQLLASSLFKKWGLSITIVDNGKMLLNEVERDAYDLILMDIQMPVMDGMEATRILRQRGVKTPVIAITAHAFKEEQIQCLKAGMNDFISKPFDEFELKNKIIEFLSAGEQNNQLTQIKELLIEKESNEVFSLDYINEMGAGDKNFVNEMLTLFIQQVPNQIASAINNWNSKNYPELGKIAHTMQSSFTMLQRVDLKHALKKVELWSKNQTSTDYPYDTFKNIITEVKTILQAVSDYIGTVITFNFESLNFQPEINTAEVTEINFKKIDELAEGNESFKKQMIELFLMQTGEQLHHLEAALKDNDFEKVGSIAHNMIPSYDLINAVKLTALCRKLEEVCKASADIVFQRSTTLAFIQQSKSAIYEVKNEAIRQSLISEE